jgi:hypothetical protein
MRRTREWLGLMLVAASGLVVWTAPARAQKPEDGSKGGAHREGFWIGVGLGWGNAGISCSGCSNNDRYSSQAVTLRMGGTMSRHLLLGGEINAWGRSRSGITETVGDMDGALYFYPSATGGLYFKGGVGIVVYDANSSPSVTTNGLGVDVGAGIDLYLGRSFSLTPYVNFLTAVGGTVKVGGTDTGFEARPNMVQVGIAAVWH